MTRACLLIAACLVLAACTSAGSGAQAGPDGQRPADSAPPEPGSCVAESPIEEFQPLDDRSIVLKEGEMLGPFWVQNFGD